MLSLSPVGAWSSMRERYPENARSPRRDRGLRSTATGIAGPSELQTAHWLGHVRPGARWGLQSRSRYPAKPPISSAGASCVFWVPFAPGFSAHRLKLNIAALRAIAAAVRRYPYGGGEVAVVTITAVKPDLPRMEGRRRRRADQLEREGPGVRLRRGSWPGTAGWSPTSRTRPTRLTTTERAGGAASPGRCVPSSDVDRHPARAGAARRLPLRARGAAGLLARGAAAHARGQVHRARRRRGGVRSPRLRGSAPMGAARGRDQARGGPRDTAAREAREELGLDLADWGAGDGRGPRLRQADDGLLLRGASRRDGAHCRSQGDEEARWFGWPIRRRRWASTPTSC